MMHAGCFEQCILPPLCYPVSRWYCPLSVILSPGGTAPSLLSCLPVVLPSLCCPVSRWYCPFSVVLSPGGTALSLLSCLTVVLNLCIGVLHPCVHPTTFMVALIYFNKIHTCTLCWYPHYYLLCTGASGAHKEFNNSMASAWKPPSKQTSPSVPANHVIHLLT